jgi:hypothetical protein
MKLVPQDVRFRQPTELAIRDSGFDSTFLTTLCEIGLEFEGEDLLWWYSVFLRHVKLDPANYFLLEKHSDLLLERRRADAIHFLLEPRRGPIGLRCEAFTHVLSALGEEVELERQWADWIRHGLFDNEVAGAEAPRVSCASIQRLIDSSIPAGQRLLNQTILHWQELARSPDIVDQRRLVRTLYFLLHSPLGGYPEQVLIGEHVFNMILAKLTPLPGFRRLRESDSLRSLLHLSISVVYDPNDVTKSRLAEKWRSLRTEIADTERATPNLPWKPLALYQ